MVLQQVSHLPATKYRPTRARVWDLVETGNRHRYIRQVHTSEHKRRIQAFDTSENISDSVKHRNIDSDGFDCYFFALSFRTKTRKTKKKNKRKNKTILKKKNLLTPPPLLLKLFELLCVLFFFDEYSIFLLSVFFNSILNLGVFRENVLHLDFSLK